MINAILIFRLEPFLSLDTGTGKNKSSEPSKSGKQSTITSAKKDDKSLIRKQCQVCQGQDCFCIIQGLINAPGSSVPLMIRSNVREFQNIPNHTEVLPLSSLVSQSVTEKIGNPSSSNRKRKASAKSKSSKAAGLKTKSTERTCTKCGLVFATHREVLLHSRIHVTEKKKEFGCHLCGKYFSQRTTLRQHLILHSGEKNFACTECGKRFALKIYLKTHQKSCGSR